MHLAELLEDGLRCPVSSEYERPRKANANVVFDFDGTKLSYKPMTSSRSCHDISSNTPTNLLEKT